MSEFYYCERCGKIYEGEPEIKKIIEGEKVYACSSCGSEEVEYLSSKSDITELLYEKDFEELVEIYNDFEKYRDFYWRKHRGF